MKLDQDILNDIPHRLPNTEIYQGLLHSGNMKYFEGDLQDKLNELYANFKDNPLNPNLVLGLEIMENLEKIIKNNRSYRTVTCISKLQIK